MKRITWKSFRSVRPGELVEFLPKPGEGQLHTYYRAGSMGKSLRKNGFAATVRTPSGHDGKVFIQVKSNPYYREKPAVAAPQPVVDVPKAVAVPTAAPCRITRQEQEARDFFASAFSICLTFEDAAAAYEKAKQATELFRRHIATYKD